MERCWKCDEKKPRCPLCGRCWECHDRSLSCPGTIELYASEAHTWRQLVTTFPKYVAVAEWIYVCRHVGDVSHVQSRAIRDGGTDRCICCGSLVGQTAIELPKGR